MLLLPRAERARIERWARLGYPHEACGLVLGAGEVRIARRAGDVVLNQGDVFSFDQLST